MFRVVNMCAFNALSKFAEFEILSFINKSQALLLFTNIAKSLIKMLLSFVDDIIYKQFYIS